MKLHPSATAAGLCLIAHDELGSTNAEALALARQGRRGPLWITAALQTAGRGRRGRGWISARGNLHASLLLLPRAPVECWPQLSFVAVLAAYDAIAEVAADRAYRLAIKWPNDILLDQRKVAGILLEGQGGNAGEPGALVIGIGVNCASHPHATNYPATDLAAGASAESVFHALSGAMLRRLAQWDGGNGFAVIRSEWLARAVGVGQEVRVGLAERDLIGRFEALDAEGGLILRLRDGTATTIAAGDVILRATALSATAT
jgi:BirA family transcriptional regulator, biotin operon repressor / biotin---[acetyl-CoA-carboxylase] ligase